MPPPDGDKSDKSVKPREQHQFVNNKKRLLVSSNKNIQQKAHSLEQQDNEGKITEDRGSHYNGVQKQSSGFYDKQNISTFIKHGQPPADCKSINPVKHQHHNCTDVQRDSSTIVAKQHGDNSNIKRISSADAGLNLVEYTCSDSIISPHKTPSSVDTHCTDPTIVNRRASTDGRYNNDYTTCKFSSNEKSFKSNTCNCNDCCYGAKIRYLERELSHHRKLNQAEHLKEDILLHSHPSCSHYMQSGSHISCSCKQQQRTVISDTECSCSCCVTDHVPCRKRITHDKHHRYNSESEVSQSIIQPRVRTSSDIGSGPNYNQRNPNLETQQIISSERQDSRLHQMSCRNMSPQTLSPQGKTAVVKTTSEHKYYQEYSCYSSLSKTNYDYSPLQTISESLMGTDSNASLNTSGRPSPCNNIVLKKSRQRSLSYLSVSVSSDSSMESESESLLSRFDRVSTSGVSQFTSLVNVKQMVEYTPLPIHHQVKTKTSPTNRSPVSTMKPQQSYLKEKDPLNCRFISPSERDTYYNDKKEQIQSPLTPMSNQIHHVSESRKRYLDLKPPKVPTTAQQSNDKASICVSRPAQPIKDITSKPPIIPKQITNEKTVNAISSDISNTATVVSDSPPKLLKQNRQESSNNMPIQPTNALHEKSLDDITNAYERHEKEIQEMKDQIKTALEAIVSKRSDSSISKQSKNTSELEEKQNGKHKHESSKETHTDKASSVAQHTEVIKRGKVIDHPHIVNSTSPIFRPQRECGSVHSSPSSIEISPEVCRENNDHPIIRAKRFESLINLQNTSENRSHTRTNRRITSADRYDKQSVHRSKPTVNRPKQQVNKYMAEVDTSGISERIHDNSSSDTASLTSAYMRGTDARKYGQVIHLHNSKQYSVVEHDRLFRRPRMPKNVKNLSKKEMHEEYQRTKSSTRHRKTKTSTHNILKSQSSQLIVAK